MLCDSLSPLEAEMKQMSELFGTEQEEIDLLYREIEALYLRLRVKTADEKGLHLWETEYGLWNNTAFTIEQRRARILAKMNSGMSATTKMLENLVKQILDADDVKIIEYPEKYCFEIYVYTQRFEENMMLAEDAVSEARPAHLAYKFINAICRKYRCGFYMGIFGGIRKFTAGIVDTGGLNLDKYRCGFYLGMAGCMKKKMEKGMVDINGLSVDG